MISGETFDTLNDDEIKALVDEELIGLNKMLKETREWMSPKEI